jgi:small subunit ribosomal protein S17
MESQRTPAGMGEEQSMAVEQTPEPVEESIEEPAAAPTEATAASKDATAVSEDSAAAPAAAPAKPKSRKQVKVGRVVSNKNDKTVVVAVDYLRRHRLYRKMLRRTSRFHAHDEHNECQMGDLVRIVESRPLSKLKRWRVTEIIQRAVQV